MKIAICDSNSSTSNEISKVIHKYYESDNINIFTNLFSLVTHVYDEKKGDVDLIIISTNVGDEDGIDAVHSLKEIYPWIQIIFLSDLTSKIQEIFLIDFVYLLILPINFHHLKRALKIVHDKYESQQLGSIVLKYKGSSFRVNVANIIYIESIGRKLYIYTNDKKWEINMKMEDIREKLPQNFMLCHRSYLVNLNYIMNVHDGDAELLNHMHIPVARVRISELKRRMEKNNIN